MKKLILVLTIFYSTIFFAQFKVVGSSAEWKMIGKYWGVIELSSKLDSAKAKINYVDFNSVLQRNMFSPSVDYSFEFSTEHDTLEKLYNMIADGLKAQKIEVVTLEFPEGRMYLNFDYSTFGGYYVTFQFDNQSGNLDKNSSGAKRSTYGINLEKLDKLFGKKKSKK